MILTAQWKRNLPKAVAFAVSGTMPAVIYAVFAVAHGGHVLPNSLLLKSTLLSAGQMDEVPFLTEPGILMLVLMAAMVAVAIWGRGSCGHVRGAWRRRRQRIWYLWRGSSSTAMRRIW